MIFRPCCNIAVEECSLGLFLPFPSLLTLLVYTFFSLKSNVILNISKVRYLDKVNYPAFPIYWTNYYMYVFVCNTVKYFLFSWNRYWVLLYTSCYYLCWVFFKASRHFVFRKYTYNAHVTYFVCILTLYVVFVMKYIFKIIGFKDLSIDIERYLDEKDYWLIN